MAKQNNLSIPEMKKKLFSEGGRASSLKGDFLGPDEIANSVLFIASTLSSATNGAAIRAEGGLLHHI
jgi:hypothetical protein